jgi:hypothetical protein
MTKKKQHFGVALAVALKKNGLLNKDLAAALNCNHCSVSRWIRTGCLSLDNKNGVLDYFGMTESKFLELSE